MSDPISQKTAPVLRESATFDRLTIQEIQRAAETGIYDIRGGGTSANCRTSMIYCCSAPVFRVTRWKVIGRSAAPT